MSVEIYYFSGTGNSLVVARDIAEKINGKIIPVVSLLDQEIIHTNADVIGFVFPIYDYKPPNLIYQFIKKITNINSKYIFAVGTYGIILLGAMKKIEQHIKACGGELSSGYVVKMPHNGIGKKNISNDEQNKMFKRWRIKLEIISENINSRKKEKPEVMNIPVHFILSGLIFEAMLPLLNLLWHVIRKGWNSLSFTSNNKCDGCGICMKICPVNNIEMVDNKPKWFEHCALCFACLQWCPKEAINAGSITEGMTRYHHPDVNISDIMKQKEIVKN